MYYFYYQPYIQPHNTYTFIPTSYTPLTNPNSSYPYTHMNPYPARYVAQNNGPTAQRNVQQPANRSPFPPVNPELLTESASQSNKLMKEASMILDKLSSSKEFSTRLMDFAQQSNTEEVKRLIQSVGITSDVSINYNPDGLELEFKSKVQNIDCCKLSISLRWR